MKVNIKNRRIIYTLIVTLIVVFSASFAILMTIERNDYRNFLQSQYSKNMYDLINDVENIEDNLSKVAVAGTPEQDIIIFQEIFRYSSNASDRLHSLPIPQETIENTSKFLSQVGDFCYTLVRSSSEGKQLSEDQYKLIDDLSDQSYKLMENLNIVLQDINRGRVKWGDIRKKVGGVLAKGENNLVTDKFKVIQKQVAQYPALIYDGPFSDNVLDIKPKVEANPKVTKEQAMEQVKNILGRDRVESIEEKQESNRTKISAYSFNIKLKNRKNEESVVCDVSKNGGKLVYLLDNKKMNKPSMDEKKAIEMGNKFLDNAGYKNMIPTYTLKYEDNVTISYIYNLNGINIYPDQIKLKVALDDGSIIGVEADKYLVSHMDNRSIPKVKISAEEARKKVSKRLNISNMKLAIIPTETNQEVLCYEYSGSYRDNIFKVYINAENGSAQKIIKIINTPNGQLAM